MFDKSLNTVIIPEKDIVNWGGSSKRTYIGVNSSIVKKYKNKIKPYIRASLYKNKAKNVNLYEKINKTKILNTNRTKDNSSYNIAMPNTSRRVGNESMLDKTPSNFKISSNLNSFDIDISKVNNTNSNIINNSNVTYTKIYALKTEQE